ncbi:MAG: trypsin-like peptidase domain-containing protein [Burkholderiales bacterium]|nr:trypsin-like peptidase domain-containing protein [Burkholderiales bacterium]
MIEPLLLAAARVSTYDGDRLLTHASGFFFERDAQLFLVTSRHVVIDTPSGHHPDRLSIELHTDAQNLTRSTGFSIPLYREGRSIWRQGQDKAGEIDVALIELERAALPATLAYRAFTPAHLVDLADLRDPVQIGSSLLIVGFPLGFHDTLHHLPVVRQAIIASAYGLRFQGEGYFLTDARTHRGTSGAPVVMHDANPSAALGGLPWRLLGVHSARLDVSSRDLRDDEALSLNCAWYADILMTLSAPSAAGGPCDGHPQSPDARARPAAAPPDPANPEPR